MIHYLLASSAIVTSCTSFLIFWRMMDMCEEIVYIESVYTDLLAQGANYDNNCTSKVTSLVTSALCSLIIFVALGVMFYRPSPWSLFVVVVCTALLSDVGELCALVLLYNNCETMTTKHLFGVDNIPSERMLPCVVYPTAAVCLAVYLVILLGYVLHGVWKGRPLLRMDLFSAGGYAVQTNMYEDTADTKQDVPPERVEMQEAEEITRATM